MISRLLKTWSCGIFQGNPAFLHGNQTPVVPATAPPTAPPTAEDLELAIAINASIQSAIQERTPLVDSHVNSEASTSSTWSSSIKTSSHCDMGEPNAPFLLESANEQPGHEIGSVHYPSIDSSPIDMSSPTVGSVPAKAGDKKEDDGSSSCIICLDAPVEGACIPCGHMVGCMSCLNGIKAAKGTCPVCRAKIQQVIRLYAVWPLNLKLGKLSIVSET